MKVYADSSALAKLVLDEAESEALVAWLLETDAELYASELCATELMRVVRRLDPERAPAVREVMAACSILVLTPQAYDQAGRMQPDELRTLDALHLAAALLAGDELDGMLSYDSRLLTAAREAGLKPIAPGRSRD